MIKSVISDFSKVLLFRKDDPSLGELNNYHESLLANGDYDFWHYFSLNIKLLNYYEKLSTNYDIHIFTASYIQEYPPVQDKLTSVFRKIFSASRLGITKSESSAYTKLAKIMDLSPEQILFIDDTQLNIDAANKAGLQTIHFTDTNTVINKISEIAQ